MVRGFHCVWGPGETIVARALGVEGTRGTGRPGVQGSEGGCQAAVLQSPALVQRAAEPLKGAANDAVCDRGIILCLRLEAG